MTEPNQTRILEILKQIQSEQAEFKRELSSRFLEISSRLTSIELRLTAAERQLILMKQIGHETPSQDWERPFDSIQKHIDELIAFLESRDKEQ